MKPFGQALRARREILGLTEREAAKALGIDTRVYKKYENASGSTIPLVGYRTLMLACVKLGVNLNALMAISHEKVLKAEVLSAPRPTEAEILEKKKLFFTKKKPKVETLESYRQECDQVELVLKRIVPNMDQLPKGVV